MKKYLQIHFQNTVTCINLNNKDSIPSSFGIYIIKSEVCLSVATEMFKKLATICTPFQPAVCIIKRFILSSNVSIVIPNKHHFNYFHSKYFFSFFNICYNTPYKKSAKRGGHIYYEVTRLQFQF